MVIYKTVTLKNTGSKDWPPNTYAYPVDKSKCQQTKLLGLPAGKETTAVLVMDGPREPGKFSVSWFVGFERNGQRVQCGEQFTLSFEVKANKADPKPEPKPEPKPDPKPDIKPEPPKKKEFSQEVCKKALQMKEIFGDADEEKLKEFISNTPNLTIDELVANYLGN